MSRSTDLARLAFRRRRGSLGRPAQRTERDILDRDPPDQQSRKRDEPGNAGDWRPGHSGGAGQLAEHADVVRMAKPPVRAGRDARRAGHDDDAEGPEGAEGENRPPLEDLLFVFWAPIGPGTRKERLEGAVDEAGTLGRLLVHRHLAGDSIGTVL